MQPPEFWSRKPGLIAYALQPLGASNIHRLDLV